MAILSIWQTMCKCWGKRHILQKVSCISVYSRSGLAHGPCELPVPVPLTRAGPALATSGTAPLAAVNPLTSRLSPCPQAALCHPHRLPLLLTLLCATALGQGEAGADRVREHRVFQSQPARDPTMVVVVVGKGEGIRGR